MSIRETFSKLVDLLVIQWSRNMIMVLRSRFQQCLRTFALMLVEESSEMWLFRHLSDYALGVKSKSWEKAFCFWDNCIWIGIVKLSLLRTGYFSLAANVLTRSPKIWHFNKRDFFQLIWLSKDQWMWWRCCDAEFNCAWAHLPYCFSKHLLKWDFLDIYLTTFLGSVTLKIQNLWGSFFYSKILKLNLDLENAAKN